MNDQIDNHGWELLVDPKELFEMTVANIINSMLFSERFTKVFSVFYAENIKKV